MAAIDYTAFQTGLNRKENIDNNMIDTLVVTATLGKRETLGKVISTVAEYGKGRTHHVIIGPLSELEKRSDLGNCEIVDEGKARSIYSALNLALSERVEKYRYFTYINDDDFWDKGFSRLFDSMDAHPEVDVAYGRVMFVDKYRNKIGESAVSRSARSFPFLLAEGIVPFTQQGTLARSSIFKECKGFDETFKLIADTEFWLKAIKSGFIFKYVNVVAALYTIQEGQLSSDRKTQMAEKSRLIKKYNLKRSFRTKIEKLKFRISNLPVYTNRFFERGRLTRR